MKEIHLVVGGKNLIAEVSAFNNKQHAAITPICLAIGIDAYTQGRKLKANPQFTPQHMLAPSAGGHQETIMLPLEEVASIGGKFMAVARGTKKMRNDLKH